MTDTLKAPSEIYNGYVIEHNPLEEGSELEETTLASSMGTIGLLSKERLDARQMRCLHRQVQDINLAYHRCISALFDAFTKGDHAATVRIDYVPSIPREYDIRLVASLLNLLNGAGFYAQEAGHSPDSFSVFVSLDSGSEDPPTI